MYLMPHTMQCKTLAKGLFPDMKMKYLQMMNIESDVPKILQGFQRTYAAERIRTHQGPFIQHCSNLELLIYSVPWVKRTQIPNTFTPIFRMYLLCTSIFNFLLIIPVLTANKSFRYAGHFPSIYFFYK